MTSLKDRQRAAARARLEREMAERQSLAQQRRKRHTWSALGAVAVLVVVGLVLLIVNVSTGKTTKPAAAAAAQPATCKWTPNPAPATSPSPGASPAPSEPVDPDLTKTGLPPATDLPHSGTRDMVMNTSQGKITIALDVTKVPCAAESFTYLASQKFFDKTTCHRLTTDGIFVLQCGDPTGKGDGGPSYTFPSENLPTDQQPNYPAGVVAMANPGNPDLNGSQFFIVWKDTPAQVDPSTGTEESNLQSQYTIIGTVTGGMDVVTKVGAGGVTGSGATDGAPKLPVKISTLTVGPVQSS